MPVENSLGAARSLAAWSLADGGLTSAKLIMNSMTATTSARIDNSHIDRDEA